MLIIFSSDDKQLCEAVGQHLRVITMITEIGNIQVIPRDETHQFGHRGKFWVVVDDRCKQYSTTMQSVDNAASDFEAGYKAAKKEYEKGDKR